MIRDLKTGQKAQCNPSTNMKPSSLAGPWDNTPALQPFVILHRPATSQPPLHFRQTLAKMCLFSCFFFFFSGTMRKLIFWTFMFQNGPNLGPDFQPRISGLRPARVGRPDRLGGAFAHGTSHRRLQKSVEFLLCQCWLRKFIKIHVENGWKMLKDLRIIAQFLLNFLVLAAQIFLVKVRPQVGHFDSMARFQRVFGHWLGRRWSVAGEDTSWPAERCKLL